MQLLQMDGRIDSENAKFCIKKAAKELNGLKLASVPDKTTCMPFET